MAEGSVATSFPFLLRFFEMICSVIAFSVVVEYRGGSKINYILFTGISALVLTIVYMAFYCAGNKAIRGTVSAVLDGVWWVLWLIAAAVATSIIVDSGNSRTRASCAFCWITWALWSVSTFISVREVQGYEYN